MEVPNSFFTPSAPYRTNNLIIRHCARSLIDRCLACGILISGKLLIHLRKPYVDANELLPVDRDCVSSINEHHGINPVTRDLAWSVVPKAIEPFFENSHFARMGHLRYTDVDRNSNDEDEEVDNSFSEINIQVTLLDEDSEFSEQQEESVSSVCFSPSAKACLKRHAIAYGLPELTQRYLAFAFAFVRAYALNLGWSEDVFIGNPQGGKCGEILGADIAILRQYSQATHGDQSSMATFGEKYVWAATHELTGFLADRVTAYDWNKRAYEPPVNLGLLAEVNNPATDIGYGQLNSDAFLDFSELIPDVDLTEPLQIDRVNEWVQTAPLPAVEPLLLPESRQLPDWAKDHEWLVLRAYIKRRNVDSQAESTFWGASYAFPRFASSLMEKSVRDRETRELYDFQAIVDAMNFYKDPCEVAWASWIPEKEGIIHHEVNNLVGQSKTVPLLAGTCQVYWRSPDGEAEEWMPAKWLRKILGVVDFHQGQFLNAAGEVLAFTLKQPGESWEKYQCHLLVARRDVVIDALTVRNLTLAWGIQIYRQPSYPLIALSNEKRMYRDWCATVFYTSDGLKTTNSKDLIRRWGEDA